MHKPITSGCTFTKYKNQSINQSINQTYQQAIDIIGNTHSDHTTIPMITHGSVCEELLSLTDLDFHVDVAMDRMYDDDVKVPSPKVFLGFGDAQQASVLLLLEIRQRFIRQNTKGPITVFLQFENGLCHSSNSLFRPDVTEQVLFLHRQHRRRRPRTARKRPGQAAMT